MLTVCVCVCVHVGVVGEGGSAEHSVTASKEFKLCISAGLSYFHV